MTISCMTALAPPRLQRSLTPGAYQAETIAAVKETKLADDGAAPRDYNLLASYASPGELVAELNARFKNGRPSDNLAEAGVLLRVNDGEEDPDYAWQPRYAARPWLSGTLVNAHAHAGAHICKRTRMRTWPRW